MCKICKVCGNKKQQSICGGCYGRWQEKKEKIIEIAKFVGALVLLWLMLALNI